MLNIFLCDDNDNELNMFSKVVKNAVMMEQLDMKFTLATPNPYEILSYLRDHQTTGIYFLDIDLKTDMTGLELAEKIREYDPRGYIIFVTTHAEMSYLTFMYKVEALDFIIKTPNEDVSLRIKQCLFKVHERHMIANKDTNKSFILKLEDTMINVPFDQILFFETSTRIHKIILHGIDRQIEFYSSLKDIEHALDERFYKCKSSCIVNKDFIEKIDITNRLIHLRNGETCHASTRLIKGLTVLPRTKI